MWLWISVTVQAPSHAQRFPLCNYFHLIYSAVTAGAANACVQVKAVIEVCVPWQFVNAHPLDGYTVGPALPYQFKFITLLTHQAVTVHACLGGWYRSDSRGFDG
jgi:hypothetical protein